MLVNGSEQLYHRNSVCQRNLRLIDREKVQHSGFYVAVSKVSKYRDMDSERNNQGFTPRWYMRRLHMYFFTKVNRKRNKRLSFRC